METRTFTSGDRRAAEALADAFELDAAERGLRPRERVVRRAWLRRARWSVTITAWHLDPAVEAAMLSPSQAAVRDALRRLYVLRADARTDPTDEPAVLHRKTLDRIAIGVCIDRLGRQVGR
jgi:hypothetical protein